MKNRKVYKWSELTLAQLEGLEMEGKDAIIDGDGKRVLIG